MPEGLDEIECPPAIYHVWEWFLELSEHRQEGALGKAGPLTFGDLYSWSRLYRVQLDPMEARTIMKLDKLYRAPSAEEEGES